MPGVLWVARSLMEANAAALRHQVSTRGIASYLHAWLWSTPLRASLTITVLWRLMLALVGIVSHFFTLPGRPQFSLLTTEGWRDNPLTLALHASVQNDSVWYGFIAIHGYSARWTSNFFPLYPLVTKIGSLVVHDVWISGLLVANASLLVAVILLHQWMKLRGQERHAALATALLLINPGAIFFGFMYSESLYLALLLATLVAYEKQRYLVASACALLLTITRPTGFLILVILMLWALRRRSWSSVLPIGASIFALAGYGVYQVFAFGTPFAQLQQAQRFGRTLAQGVADLTLQATPGYPRAALVLLLITGLIYLACTLLVYRYWGREYAVLGAVMIVFPALTGLASYQRYIGVAFMIPAAVAVWGNRRIVFAWLTWNFWFTIAAAALFTTGLVY